MAASSTNSIGYGPSSQWQNLCFNGDERKYEQWEIRFLGFLKIKKLKSIAVPTDPENPPTDQDTRDKNEEVFALLCQFLDETSLSLIIRDAKDDGRKAIKILREHYQGTSKPRIISLWTELSKLEKSSDETVTEYLLHAEKTSTMLKAAGVEVSDSLLVAMCLKGLPESYESLRTHVIHAEPAYTFQKFKESLKSHEETRKSCQTDSGDNVLNLNGKTITCFKCKKPGHKANACPKGKRNTKWCPHCKSGTHYEKDCRKVGKVEKVKTAAEGEKHIVFTFNDVVNESIKNASNTNSLFLVDSGASAHVMNTLEYFISFDESFKPEEHFIELADGSKTYSVAERRGTVLVNLVDQNGKNVDVKLEGVLYIPSYPQWIFSVRAATAKEATVIFSSNTAVIISPTGDKFPVYLKDKLYYLYKTDFSSKGLSSLEDWHRLLGHCNPDDVAKLQECVTGMELTDRLRFDCESCSISKMTGKSTGPPRETRSTEPFELIFTDLAGPLDPTGMHGYRYVIVFTDDYTGCLFTYLLKNKSDASTATERFLSDVSPFGKVKCFSFHDDVFPSGEVRTIRSDNGGEYLSSDFKRLLLKNGIRHELTAPYSPHMNGCAERSWRTLFDMARTMIHESQLPKYMWVYAVMHASYIRNRCYNRRLKDTPYGAITGKRPDLSNLHVFGSICYTYNEGHKKKLDARGRKGIFVGYDKNSPSYLVYYPENNSVLKHRVVKFTDKFDFSKPQLPPHHDGLIEDFTDDTTNTKSNIDEQVVELPEQEENADDNRRQLRQNRGVPPERLGIDRDHAKLVRESMDVLYMLRIPNTYTQAIDDTDHSDDWRKAMDDEMNALTSSETYELVEQPQDHAVIGGKWVYDVKGSPENPRYKARYVARGFTQIEGVDFDETFAPTPRMENLRMMVQIAAQENLTMHQMDVKSAFLHADLEEEIFMQPPKGYEQYSPNGKMFVWKLRKSLYGLKQSGRNWFRLLESFLLDDCSFQNNIDPCTFILRTDADEKMIILVWVDDLIMVSSSQELLNCIKEQLKKRFEMKDLGEVIHFLGIEFSRDGDKMMMKQTQYLKNILKRFQMESCRPRTSPCESNTQVYEQDDEPFDPRTYREAVGSLVYAMVSTRPDLCYAVSKLSQTLSNPTTGNWQMLKHVFQYIQGTLDLGLVFRKTDKLGLIGYADADWANSNDRKSMTGYCFMMSENGPAISWKTQKQTSTALSTCEAEYMALSAASQEAIYLIRIYENLTGKNCSPVKIFGDNQGSLALVKNPIKHGRSKHIDIRYHFVRDCVAEGKVELSYIPSNDNLADPFTKPLSRVKLNNLREKLFGLA